MLIEIPHFLSFLPLLWPRVLKLRIYLYLVCGLHDLYLGALLVLFSEGLLRPRDGHCWSLLVGGCVRVADGAWVRAEMEEDGTWRLEMKGHFIFTWKPRNFFEERVLLTIFRHFYAPHSTAKRPFLWQEWLAEWFGTYQELISRWQKYVRNYPDGVRLYSSWTVDTVIWAMIVYMHLRTTYRRAADVVGVSPVTLWRWAMAVGQQGLPIATLFGGGAFQRRGRDRREMGVGAQERQARGGTQALDVHLPGGGCFHL